MLNQIILLKTKQHSHKEWLLKNKEKMTLYRKTHYKENREIYLERSKKWAEKNKRRRKHNVLMATHGISIDTYESMLVKQNYKCACCPTLHSDLTRGLFVDHDHITGKIRGLLCTSCNSSLGYAKDNIEVLLNMVKYLQTC